MLTAQSPEILGNLYGTPDEYAFPLPYDLDQLRIDMGRSTLRMYVHGENPYGLTSDEAMVRFHDSAPGRHQANQTARFSGFHKDLVVPRSLEAAQDSPWAALARHAMLDLMSTETVQRYGFYDVREHANLHPLGHSAAYHNEINRALQHMPLSEFSSEDIALLEHSAVLHDIPETLHPGVILSCGGALGDIATGGKTPQDKKLEFNILEHLLYELYGDVYSIGQRKVQARFIRHDEENLTKPQRVLHTLAEFAHDMTHRETATNTLERTWREHSPYWMTELAFRLAYDVYRYTTPKIEQAKQELPESIHDYIDRRAEPLNVQILGHNSIRKPNGKTITSMALIKRWDAQRERKEAKLAMVS